MFDLQEEATRGQFFDTHNGRTAGRHFVDRAVSVRQQTDGDILQVQTPNRELTWIGVLGKRFEHQKPVHVAGAENVAPGDQL